MIQCPFESPETIGQEKYNEAIEIGHPVWIAYFALKIYDNEIRPKRKKFDREKFREEFDAEVEEIRNFLQGI